MVRYHIFRLYFKHGTLQINDLRKIGWRLYFMQFWSWVELSIVGLSFAAAGFYVSRFFVAQQVASTFEETHGNVFIKLQMAGWLDEQFIALQV